MKVKIDGKYKSAPEGPWLFVGRIKIPCFYFLHGVKVRKSSLRKNINMRFNFSKNTSVCFTLVKHCR